MEQDKRQPDQLMIDILVSFYYRSEVIHMGHHYGHLHVELVVEGDVVGEHAWSDCGAPSVQLPIKVHGGCCSEG